MTQNWENLYYQNKILNGINGFVEDYKILSNFAEHEKISIILPYGDTNGKKYSANNIETLYQAAKTKIIWQIEEIIKANKPDVAFYLGRRCKIRDDWEQIKEDVMKELVRKKFNVSNKFRNTLLSIHDDKFIVGMNKWNDKEWGVCSKTFKGQNKLGQILMDLKKEKKGI